MAEQLEDALRLVVNTSSTDAMLDTITEQKPDMWRGNSLRIEFGLFKGKNASKVALSVANYSAITCEVKAVSAGDKAPAPGDTVLMTKTLVLADLDDTMTATTFDNGTKQHGIFEFTYVETNLTFSSGETSKKFWMVISAIGAGDRRVTLGATLLNMLEDGTSAGAASPPVGDPDYYTAIESDARYVNATGDTMAGALLFSGTTHAGLRVNSLTTTQRDALTPVNG